MKQGGMGETNDKQSFKAWVGGLGGGGGRRPLQLG